MTKNENDVIKVLQSRWANVVPCGLSMIRKVIGLNPKGTIPDAAILDQENKELIWFEIENTRPVQASKISAIQRFAMDAFDIEEWRVLLVLVSNRGVCGLAYDSFDDVCWGDETHSSIFPRKFSLQ